MSYKLVILSIFFIFAFAEIARRRFFLQPSETSGDKWVEIISTFSLTGLVQPLVLLTAATSAAWLFPDAKNMLANTSLLLQITLFLIFDDMMQYWWHRASHSVPFLYGLHRAHHNGGYMSIRIVYRNNIFYYALMPSIWFSGVLIYLGLGEVYAGYIIVKLTVIYGAHSNAQWDKSLYQVKWLSPVMWFLERTISTPATHAAHHGKYASDPATNYKGNFGNLLFFWDIVFGTAKITRKYPEEYGVENLAPMSTGAQLLWPLLRDPLAPTADDKSV